MATTITGTVNGSVIQHILIQTADGRLVLMENVSTEGLMEKLLAPAPEVKPEPPTSDAEPAPKAKRRGGGRKKKAPAPAPVATPAPAPAPKAKGGKGRKVIKPLADCEGIGVYTTKANKQMLVAIFKHGTNKRGPWYLVGFISKDEKWASHEEGGFFVNKLDEIHWF